MKNFILVFGTILFYNTKVAERLAVIFYRIPAPKKEF